MQTLSINRMHRKEVYQNRICSATQDPYRIYSSSTYVVIVSPSEASLSHGCTLHHLLPTRLRDGLSWVTDVTTLQGDWTGLLSFVSAVLLSTFILLFSPSSFVSLSNFYLAVPMRGCLGKHSCMSSPFPIAILNETCSLRARILFCGDVPAIKTKLNKQTNYPPCCNYL